MEMHGLHRRPAFRVRFTCALFIEITLRITLRFEKYFKG